MRRLICTLFLVFTGAAAAQTDTPVSKIIFGSCIKQDNPIPIFDTILTEKPEVFLFLGDNIYADTDDMELMREKYNTLGANPGFKKLRETATILATWDDHDYGINDGGADYPKRKEAQKEFLDFWKDPQDSARRKREGVYGSEIFGPEGQRVQVILLDTRYFRSPLKKGGKRLGGSYYPDNNPELTMLGEAQWKWLETELKKPAEIRLIGSGIQIVPEAAGQETWANLPLERQKLFDLITKTKANGVILLSGDRHWAEFSRTTEDTPYPIYDFTSSSFNQAHPRGTPTKNRFRISTNTYHRENFGEIKIQWAGANTRIEVRVRDLRGNARLSHSILLPELAAR
ncbi:MAG: alkaline phosphatase D family protein [Verrucomicrobiales bacterium]|nr:alkaline phosphatase D family protein [Verrucomicrobiales bacterium]